MVALPSALPVTTPPDTDAMPDALLDHVPPVVASLSVTVVPRQILIGPDGVMAAGEVLTVTVANTIQPPTA
jgi:hypothetical protein